MRTIVIGDIHGCAEEFRELLQTVDYKQGRDDLVLAGDLLDRGPSPREVVEDAMRFGARRVRGNHEEKALRWLRHEERAVRDPKYRNPMRPVPEERRAEWRSLSEDQVRWLQESPIWLDIGNNWLVVHAGFEPGLSLDQQKDSHVVRVRYVNAKGEMIGFAEGSMDQPADTVYWTEQWKGPQNVVYGHAVHSKEFPRIDYRDSMGLATSYSLKPIAASLQCVGIDTGCCFGGRLTAMVLDGARYAFTQVQAAREYYPWPGGQGTTSGDG